MIRVMIADDHHLVRQGIRALLEKYPDIEVVWEAQDGLDALHYCIQIEPDVLLLDINMPRMNGIEVVQQIAMAQIRTQVVILSMYSEEALVERALRSGAQGYLLKKSIAEDLLAAIHAASQGSKYVSAELAHLLCAEGEPITTSESLEGFESLSPREREVCLRVVKGYTNHAIAAQLGISIKTVEKHRSNLMGKLGVKDVAGLIREAVRVGIIFLEG